MMGVVLAATLSLAAPTPPADPGLYVGCWRFDMDTGRGWVQREFDLEAGGTVKWHSLDKTTSMLGTWRATRQGLVVRAAMVINGKDFSREEWSVSLSRFEAGVWHGKASRHYKTVVDGQEHQMSGKFTMRPLAGP